MEPADSFYIYSFNSDQTANSFPEASIKLNRRPPGKENMSRVKGEVKFGRNWMTTLGAVSKYCRDHANEKPLA
jgi:hypothetical protein